MVDVDKICVVTVTYGNRMKYLIKVVSRLLDEGVKHIVVVDNDSSCDVMFEQKEVKVIHSDVNLGAGAGFRLGLKEALKSDCSHFLLLDDDNLINVNVISRLASRIVEGDVLFCFRHYDWDFLIKRDSELRLNNLERDTLNVNSFCYFSIEKLFRMFNKMFVKRVPNNKEEYFIVANGYGGCFVGRDVLNVVGLPKDDYGIYWGDVSWTYSMLKEGVDLVLLPDCKITDLERSLFRGRVMSYFKVGDILDNIHECGEKKLVSEYRDRVVFEKNELVFDQFSYFVNRLVFYYLIFPIVKVLYWFRFGETKNLDILMNAVREGEKLEL